MKVADLAGKVKGYIYPNDHNPPHVHFRAPGASCSIEIKSRRVMVNNGFESSEIRLLKSWVIQNEATLLENWEDLHGEEN